MKTPGEKAETWRGDLSEGPQATMVGSEPQNHPLPVPCAHLSPTCQDYRTYLVKASAATQTLEGSFPCDFHG